MDPFVVWFMFSMSAHEVSRRAAEEGRETPEESEEPEAGEREDWWSSLCGQ